MTPTHKQALEELAEWMEKHDATFGYRDSTECIEIDFNNCTVVEIISSIDFSDIRTLLNWEGG